MSPKKLDTRPSTPAEGRQRRVIAEKYLEVAQLIGSEDGASINVCGAVAVLAGIAASDGICAASLGRRYSGKDHHAAADLLAQVDTTLGAGASSSARARATTAPASSCRPSARKHCAKPKRS